MASQGALWGLLLGIGLAMIWSSFWPSSGGRSSQAGRGFADRLRDDLVAAGLSGYPLWQVGLAIAVVSMLTLLAALAFTQAPLVALFFALLAAGAIPSVIRNQALKRRQRLRDVWPDVVDHVASAVRAGLALPEALIQVGERGPEELREPFRAFADDYRATGHFADSLDRLKERLADPVADRLCEALRLARDVGGSDLGRLLRTLSAFLREDARTRAELHARQSWTVNAARLAMAAPWLILLLLCTRAESIEAYRQPTGLVVLVVGAVTSIAAYRLMRVLGRLPEEKRVFA